MLIHEGLFLLCNLERCTKGRPAAANVYAFGYRVDLTLDAAYHALINGGVCL
jgi:hypothetical protein